MDNTSLYIDRTEVEPYWIKPELTIIDAVDRILMELKTEITKPPRLLGPAHHFWDGRQNHRQIYDSDTVCNNGLYHPNDSNGLNHDESCPHLNTRTEVNLLKIKKGQLINTSNDLSSFILLSGRVTFKYLYGSHGMLVGLRNWLDDELKITDASNKPKELTPFELLANLSVGYTPAKDEQGFYGPFPSYVQVENIGTEDAILVSIETSDNSRDGWVRKNKYEPSFIGFSSYMNEMVTDERTPGITLTGNERKKWLVGPKNKSKSEISLVPGIAIGLLASRDVLIEPNDAYVHPFNTQIILPIPLDTRYDRYGIAGLINLIGEKARPLNQAKPLFPYTVWTGQAGFEQEGEQKILYPGYLYLLIHFYRNQDVYPKVHFRMDGTSFVQNVYSELVKRGINVYDKEG